MDNLYDIENTALTHHLDQALRANYIMLLDIDYVVQDNKVLIVDQFTGRIMDGRRYSDGLHQAIEAKEGVEIEDETKQWRRLRSKTTSGCTKTSRDDWYC